MEDKDLTPLVSNYQTYLDQLTFVGVQMCLMKKIIYHFSLLEINRSLDRTITFYKKRHIFSFESEVVRNTGGDDLRRGGR